MHGVPVLNYYIIQGLTVDSIVIFALLKETGNHFSLLFSAISYYH